MKLVWFGQVQIRLFWTDFYILDLSKTTVLNNMDLTKTNLTLPKVLVLDQNELDGPK